MNNVATPLTEETYLTHESVQARTDASWHRQVEFRALGRVGLIRYADDAIDEVQVGDVSLTLAREDGTWTAWFRGPAGSPAPTGGVYSRYGNATSKGWSWQDICLAATLPGGVRPRPVVHTAAGERRLRETERTVEEAS